MDFGMLGYIRHGEPDQYWYDCSKKTLQQWYETGQRRPILAIYLAISGNVFLTFYVLSLIGIIRARLIFKSPCYVVMLFMGGGDLIMTCISSQISAYFFWPGAVYCCSPKFIYWCGAVGLAAWTSSCLYCMTLATSRLAEITGATRITKFLGRRACFWICLTALTIGIIFGFLTPAPLFNSPMGAWFFSPFNESGLEYDNLAHRLNNLLVSAWAIIVYSCMCWRASKNWAWADGMSKAQRLLYIQAFIICTTHVGAAWGYLLMNYIPGFPPSLVLCGHIAWQWSHGVPGLVYFLLNRSVRRSVFALFGVNSKFGIFTVSDATTRRSNPSSNTWK